MSEDGDRISAPPRALRRLVEELRDEAAPPIDWDRVEARLLDEVDREPRVAARRAAEQAIEGNAEILVPWDDDGPADEAALSEAVRSEAVLHEGRREEDPQEIAASGKRGPASLRALALASAGGGTSGASASHAGSSAERVGARDGSRRTSGARWAILVAAVAAAAAWLLVPRFTPSSTEGAEPVDLELVAVAPRLVDAFDLASLRAGDVVEAIEGPVRFGREGVLSWTLSAGGRVRVVAGLGRDGSGHVVSLESGALAVEVVPVVPDADEASGPSGGPRVVERFVVEVDRARVAVHGTAFQVVRSSRGLVVDVTRGVVSVGPRQGGGALEHRLVGPARGSFGLDGASYRELPVRSASLGSVPASSAGAGAPVAAIDRSSSDERYAGVEISGAEDASSVLPRRDEGAARGPTGRGPGSGEAGRSASDPATSPEGSKPGAEPESPGLWSTERVRQEVQGCILRTGASTSSETRVTVASRLVVDVDAAGAAVAVRFEPPIRPDLQACAQPVFRARLAPGTGRLAVPIEVSFGGPATPPAGP